MATSYVGAYAGSGASLAVPTYQAGDDIYVAARRSYDWPGAPAEYTQVTYAQTSTYYVVLWRKTATSGSGSDTVSSTGASHMATYVVRGSAGCGAAAAVAESTTAPGLTLQEAAGASWVLAVGMGLPALPDTPAGATSRVANSLVRVSDTAGGVTSWSSSSTTLGHHIAVEILAAPIVISAPTIPTGETHYTGQWLYDGQIRLSAPTIPTGESVGGGRLVIADWTETITTDWWRAMVTATSRRIRYRCELIHPVSGDVVADLPAAEVSVEHHGSQPEQWAGSISLADPDWWPLRDSDLLAPPRGLLARVWWEQWADSGWSGVPLATMDLLDPRVSDREGSWSAAWTLRDRLATAKRGGYGGRLLDVSGQTVTAALRALFAAVAPRLPVRIPDTDVTLPAAHVLGVDGTPAQDWTDLADLAGWVVRTDRWGVVTVGPRSPSAVVRADWSEGPDCRIVDLDRDVTTSGAVNRVVVRGAHIDHPGIVAVVQDDDPASPTWVGTYGPYERVIESDSITSQAGADSMARLQYGRLRLPRESVTVRVPARPDLSYGDTVIVGRARSGVSGMYRVSGWTIRDSAGAPALMEVRLMSQALDDE